MEHARCKCLHDSAGARTSRHIDCPIHGFTGMDPKVDWALTPVDRQFLRVNRIAADDIEEVRKADEDRFRPR